MDAIVNLVLASAVSAAIAHPGFQTAFNETESASIRDTIAVNAICTKIKCHGDFPVSSTRRYAEAKHDARNGSARI